MRSTADRRVRPVRLAPGWAVAAWSYYDRRLGQFAPVEVDAGAIFYDALDRLLDEWDDLDDGARSARVDEVAQLRDPEAFAHTEEQFSALGADEKLAIVERRNAAQTEVLRSAASGKTARPATLETAPPTEPPAAGTGDEPVTVPGADPEVVTAAGDDPGADDLGDDRWHAILFVEGVTTNDGRAAAAGAMSTRPLPLPLMYITQKSAMGGHDGAMLGGSIESIVRNADLAAQLAEGGFLSLADGAALLVAEGSYGQTPEGQDLRGLVNRQELRFISADTEILEAEEVYPLDGDEMPFLRMTRGNIMGGTACPFPAFAQCIIGPASKSLYDLATQGFSDVATEIAPNPTSPVAVAASAAPLVPPAAWFDNPQFGADDLVDRRLIEDPNHPGFFYCPLTVGEDGRVYGHVAAWHRDHIGHLGKSLKPPHSNTDYADFSRGTVEVDRDGVRDVIRCGVITMNTGHAPLTGLGASSGHAKRHYDDTGAQAAHVEVGEDAHGIWMAGALVPGLPDEDVRNFRAGGVSGDWRPAGNGVELVAVLSVNVPGFPMPRPRRSFALTADGETHEERELALVAAGYVPPRDPMMDEVERRISIALAPIREQLTLLAPIALEAQTNRLRP